MPRNLAIFVGVNDYNADWGLRPLRFCGNDADLISVTLQTAFPTLEPIETATGRFTRGDFEAAISLVAESGLSDEDQVIIAFAGHGFTHRGSDYLAFSDTKIEEEHSWLSVTEVQRRLRESGAGKILMLLDCCREVLSRGSRDIQTFRGLATQDAKMDVAAFLGCRIGEVSQEYDSLGTRGNGIFTRALCTALQENIGMPLRHLEARVQQIAEETIRQHGLRHQRPQVVGPFAYASMDILGRDTDSSMAQLQRPPRMIVLTGPTQAGKTTVGRRLQEILQFRHIEMSGYVARRYREFQSQTKSHDSIQDYVERELWSTHGDDVIANDLLHEINGLQEDLIVTGGRNPAEIERFQQPEWDILQVYLHANASMRWQRLVQSTDDYVNQRYEAFVHRNLREFSWGLAKTGAMQGSRIVINEDDELGGVRGIVKEMNAHGWRDATFDGQPAPSASPIS